MVRRMVEPLAVLEFLAGAAWLAYLLTVLLPALPLHEPLPAAPGWWRASAPLALLAGGSFAFLLAHNCVCRAITAGRGAAPAASLEPPRAANP